MKDRREEVRRQTWVAFSKIERDADSSIFNQTSNDSKQARLEGAYAYQQGSFQTARVFFEKALSLDEKNQDTTGVAKDLFNLGNLEFVENSFQEALRFYESALSLFQERSDQQGLAQTVLQMGETYFHLADYQNALTCIRNARIYFQEIANRQGQEKALVRQAALLMFLGDIAEAKGILQQLSQEISPTQNLSQSALADHLLSGIFIQEKSWVQAREWIDRALKKTEVSSELRSLRIQVLLRKAEVLIHEGKTYEADEILSHPLLREDFHPWIMDYSIQKMRLSLLLKRKQGKKETVDIEKIISPWSEEQKRTHSYLALLVESLEHQYESALASEAFRVFSFFRDRFPKGYQVNILMNPTVLRLHHLMKEDASSISKRVRLNP